MNKMSSILVLNTLIGINNDRIAGYQMASNATEEFDLKTYLKILFKQVENVKEISLAKLIKWELPQWNVLFSMGNF